MSAGFGQNCWIGTAEEVTYGTPVNPPTKFLEVLEESIMGKQSVISKPSLRSVSQKNRVKGKKSVEGSFSFQMMYEGAERILKHAMGSVSTGMPTGGYYTHTFALAQTLPTGLTIYVNRDGANIGANSAFQYEGCQIAKLTFKQSIEDFLTVEAEIVGEDWTNVAVVSPTFPTFIGVDWAHTLYYQLAVGTTSLKCEDFELTLDNGLATDRYWLGSVLRKGFGRSGPRKITGKMTVEFESLAEYNFYKNLTETDLVVRWNSGNYSLLITLPKVVFGGEDPTVKDAGPIKLPLSFEAFQNTAAHDEMSIQLSNQKDSTQI